MNSENRKKCILGLAFVVLLWAIDFLTKQLAIYYLKPISEIPLIKGIFVLHYTENQGAAFGIFAGKLLPVLIITPIIVGLVSWLYVKSIDLPKFKAFRTICIFFVAGTLGNFVDRVIYKYVVDFFYFELIDFAIFNVADIYLTLSTIVLLFLIIFYYKDSDWNFIKIKRGNYGR